ncbi:MAG: hypothetical protein ACOCNL_14570 [Acetivibrio ethanolgignens]
MNIPVKKFISVKGLGLVPLVDLQQMPDAAWEALAKKLNAQRA